MLRNDGELSNNDGKTSYYELFTVTGKHSMCGENIQVSAYCYTSLFA